MTARRLAGIGMVTPLSLPDMRLAALLLLLVPAIAASAQAPAARVEIDHATGNATLIVTRGARADTSDLGDTPVVRLAHSVPVDVRVVNTNTALYRFSRTIEGVPLPEAEALQGFATRLTPYVPELRASLRNRGVRGTGEAPTEAAIAEARLALTVSLGAAERSLLTIDDAVYGERGLQPTLSRTLLALEQMRRGTPAEQASAPLRQRLNLGPACGEQEPVRLQTAEQLLTALSSLGTATDELRDATYGMSYADARWQALRDSAQVLDRRAQAALGDFEPLVATAYRVERLVGIVANACSHWSAGTVSGSRTQGKSVTIRVEPRAEPEVARIAERAPVQYTVVVQPRAVVRPAVAIAAIAAPGARFPTYGTREVAGGFEVFESGRKDRRFGLGGTLGFTWPGLDGRDGSGIAVWLPEILVAAGDLTGAGVGTAVSAGFAKIGVGALWMRHESVAGVRAGDVVADPAMVQVVEGYGKPRLYISLSVFDWAPFADRIPGG